MTRLKLVTPRPVLEIIAQPVYHCRRLDFPQTRFLCRPEEGDLFVTNLKEYGTGRIEDGVDQPGSSPSGSFDAPEVFNVHGISASLPEDDPEVAAYLKLNAFLQFQIGEKEYLGIPLRYAFAQILDLRIEEERVHPTSGVVMATGRLVPLHIPSCLRFWAMITCRNVPDEIRERPPLLDVAIWGNDYREIF